MSFPRSPVEVVEFGFQVPEAERWSPGEGIPTETLEQAEAFVRAHPGCRVVRRRVVVEPWEPVEIVEPDEPGPGFAHGRFCRPGCSLDHRVNYGRAG